jgi:RHS repeat-associated protein
MSENHSYKGQTETYVSNAANMTTSRNGQGYTYDTNGNTLTGGGRTNVWDSQNRLYSCAYAGNTNVFTYGVDGLRHSSMINGIRTDFAFDDTYAIREMRDTNNDGILESIATYFSGNQGPMYKRDDTNGTLRWYIYDGLGSVLAEVDPSGSVTAGRKYDVYGLVRSGQAGISKHKFVGKLGHVSEDETGLIYMRARYMDPVLGAFVSEDPALHGSNWYRYCNNNPVNYTDMSGKEADPVVNNIIFGTAWTEAAVCIILYMEQPWMALTAEACLAAATYCFVIASIGLELRGDEIKLLGIGAFVISMMPIIAEVLVLLKVAKSLSVRFPVLGVILGFTVLNDMMLIGELGSIGD